MCYNLLVYQISILLHKYISLLATKTDLFELLIGKIRWQ
jgi:hypothetical protein